MVQTLLSGAVALGVVATTSAAPFPLILAGVVTVLCLFAPYRKSASARSLKQNFTDIWLPSVGVILVSAAVARFAFGESWAFGMLAPTWLAGLVVLKVLCAPSFWNVTRALVSSTSLGVSRLEKPRRVIVHLATDFSCTLALIAGAGLWLAHRCDPTVHLGFSAVIGAALLWIILDQVPVRRWQAQKRADHRAAAVALRYFVWASLLVSYSGHWILPWLFVIGLLFVLYLSLLTFCRIGTAENFRWAVVGTYSLILMGPVAAPYLEGNGDSIWYGMTMADVLTQARHGVFPVFVGQSVFQFNGNYSPLRLAPLFHHLGIAIDFLTWCFLDPAVIQSLVLVGCGVAAGLSAYLALRIVAAPHRWLAMILACSYVASPGIMAVMYDERLYMTWTVMPWIPIALLGFVQTFRAPGLRPYLILVLGLGLIWWGHSPVALWLTGVLFLGQCFRLLRDRSLSSTWIYSVAAAVLLLAIIAYPIVSVLFVPADAKGATATFFPNYKQIAQVITESFRDSLLPVLRKGRTLSDFQFGWPLLAILLATLLVALRKGGALLWSILAQVVFLLLFLVPIPGLLVLCWKHVPGFVLGPTGDWAAPRLYPIAISLVIFGAAVTAGLLSRRVLRWVYVFALLGIGWTTLEAWKFVKLGEYALYAGSTVNSPLYPENVALSRYSYTIFATPPPYTPYFSHGVVDPALEQRVFAEDRTTVIAANTPSILTAGNSSAGIEILGSGPLDLFNADPDSNRIWETSQHFVLEPGHHYLLEIKFAHPETPAILTLKGSRLQRVYNLPAYGGPEAFGSLPTSSPALPLWTTSKKPEAIKIQFVINEPSTVEAVSPLGAYRWIEYSEDVLPVQVVGWLPYTARVRSPQAGWLETPKIYLQNYVATVDGRSARVVKSDRGLTMIQVPQGESRVRLSFAAPLKLTASYLFSLASILAIFVTCVGGWIRQRRAQAR